MYSHDAIAQAEQWAGWAVTRDRQSGEARDLFGDDTPPPWTAQDVTAAAQISQAYSQLAVALLGQERTGA
jgi:hypothetical protein